MNNFEKIKAMSIDEMIQFITYNDCCYCPASCCQIWNTDEKYTNEACNKYAKQWLEQESEEE